MKVLLSRLVLAAVSAGGAAALAVTGCGGPPAPAAAESAPRLPPVAASALRPVSVFASIPDRASRSRALFLEATRVMFHPRCKNCHPAGDVPAQGELGMKHDPPVLRGPADHGVVGLECTSCHQDRNLELSRVPGAAKWALAPRSMSWVDKTPRTLCEQLKDTRRNGGKSMAEILEHVAHDPLVAWGWAPGHGRAPAPGTQAELGVLMKAWADAGAECPLEETRR